MRVRRIVQLAAGLVAIATAMAMDGRTMEHGREVERVTMSQDVTWLISEFGVPRGSSTEELIASGKFFSFGHIAETIRLNNAEAEDVLPTMYPGMYGSLSLETALLFVRPAYTGGTQLTITAQAVLVPQRDHLIAVCWDSTTLNEKMYEIHVDPERPIKYDALNLYFHNPDEYSAHAQRLRGPGLLSATARAMYVCTHSADGPAHNDADAIRDAIGRILDGPSLPASRRTHAATLRLPGFSSPYTIVACLHWGFEELLSDPQQTVLVPAHINDNTGAIIVYWQDSEIVAWFLQGGLMPLRDSSVSLEEAREAVGQYRVVLPFAQESDVVLPFAQESDTHESLTFREKVDMVNRLTTRHGLGAPLANRPRLTRAALRPAPGADVDALEPTDRRRLARAAPPPAPGADVDVDAREPAALLQRAANNLRQSTTDSSDDNPAPWINSEPW